jgi:hypothetical protein
MEPYPTLDRYYSTFCNFLLSVLCPLFDVTPLREERHHHVDDAELKGYHPLKLAPSLGSWKVKKVAASEG